MITICQGANDRKADIVTLFTQVFSASEGEVEGQNIGALVTAILRENSDDQLQIFTAEEGEELVAAVIF